jgi:hypothetical protein
LRSGSCDFLKQLSSRSGGFEVGSR